MVKKSLSKQIEEDIKNGTHDTWLDITIMAAHLNKQDTPLCSPVWLASATIITTSDNPDMHEIHDRMPVILESDLWDRWLDPALHDRHELEAMLRPPPAGTLKHYPVSKDVGNVTNNDAHLLEVAPG